MIYFIAFIIIGIILWCSFRTNELFRLSVRNGRVLLVRGRIPPGLLNDFRIVLAASPVARATIRAYRDRAGARLSVSGEIDAGQEQRLRNVFQDRKSVV